jgi:hypothetical protein
MLFIGWEVRTEKYFPEVSEAARASKVEGRFRDRGKIFFKYGPTSTVNNVFIFLLDA